MSLIGLLQAAAILTIVFSFVTGLGITHRNIELFSHFRLQYLLVSGLLLIVFAIFRNYAYAGALAVTFVFNAAFIVPWYFAEDSAADGTPLKLILANVYSGNANYRRMIDFIVKESPDMFFLQEVTSEWLAGTKSLLGDYPHAYAESRDGNFGIAAFSKIPFDSIEHIDSPPLGYPSIVATITIDDQPLTIISSHPTIPVGQHLYESRNEHLDSISELTRQTSGKIVLLGDFNASIWCRHLARLEQNTGLKNARRGFGILPSWPTFFPFAMIPIDHALVSKSISVSELRTGQSIGSDHLPLVVTLSL